MASRKTAFRPTRLTKIASLEGDQRVYPPNYAQSRPDRPFGRLKSALFEIHGPETVGIVEAEVFTGCGDTKNAGSPGSRR